MLDLKELGDELNVEQRSVADLEVEPAGLVFLPDFVFLAPADVTKRGRFFVSEGSFEDQTFEFGREVVARTPWRRGI